MEVIHKINRQSQKQSNRQKLMIRDREVIYVIAFSDIVAFTGEGNYTSIWLSNGSQMMSSRTLCYYEKQIDDRFYRIHKSHVINVDFIQRISLRDSKVILLHDLSLAISRSKKKAFKTYCKSCFLDG